MNESSEILLVVTSSGLDPNDPLIHALASLKYQVVFTGNCREAYRRLRLGDSVAVVLCDLSLPDGNWCDIIRFATSVQSNARILIRAEEADERLWSEALWRGVYDLLINPFSVEEARRAIDAAGRAADYPIGRCATPPEPARRTAGGAAAPLQAAGSNPRSQGTGRLPAQRSERSTSHVENRSRGSAARPAQPEGRIESFAAAS